MQTILTNGPTSNRLNIVVLSEGYTSSQLAKFLADATNAVNTLLSHSPYQEYRTYVNAFAIKVASAESGSDHPSYGIYRNTYFNSTYDAYDYLITIPTNSTGQGRVDALLQTFMPQCQLPILLVNDPADGGSDGFFKTAIVSTGGLTNEASSGQPGILSHETGHVLANLGDEYTTPYPGFPNSEEPNTTQQTNRLLIKWRTWISTNTPVPTPNSAGDGVVGLFEGAHYHATGWYRPELNCAMGSLGVPFCAVCSEALVLAIYQRARPVDVFSPAGTKLSVTTTQALAFGLTLLQPSTHNLSVQWFTNGVPCAGATNSAFALLPQFLPNGSNWVSAAVRDNTSLVRNDPTNLLTQNLTWTLNVSLPQLRLDSPRWLGGGKFSFRISGNAPQGFSIWGTTNLATWVSLSTNSLVAGQYWYTNTGAASFNKRLFRAVTPP
jgi:IgA Peptidase M64